MARPRVAYETHTAEDILSKARGYLPLDKLSLIEDAFDFAFRAHDGQKRLSGEPYVEHPINTALFLTELNLDASTLAAACSTT